MPVVPAPVPCPASEYRGRIERCRASLSRLGRWSFVLSNLRLALFLLGVTTAILAWMGKLPRPWIWGAGGLMLAFLAAAIAHDKVIGRERRTRLRLDINERGLARLEDRWAELPQRGEHHSQANHPYAKDLDLFGSSSLFQLVDCTTTRSGEELLAGWLNKASPRAEILERQSAVRELSPRLDFREELETEGRVLAAEKPDPRRIIAFAETGLPKAARGRWRLALFSLPALTLGLYLAARFGLVTGHPWAIPLLAQAAVAIWCSRAAGRICAELRAPGEQLLRFEGVFRVLEAAGFEAAPLRRARERLESSGAAPSVEMRRLDRALSFLQLREQPLFHIPLNVLVLWDLGWTEALLRWRARCGPRVRGWIDALAEVEALSSLAAFAHDHPAFAYPELLAEGPRFEAESLGHPLLPESRRVCNDVALVSPGASLLITGSNMAGKTTLLRTIGINTVLALAGAPVCARRACLSPLDVRTSMRVQDSLAQGLSFFHAEVQRLKGVLDASASGQVLFLLDEVLQGTNTAERQLASRGIVRLLIERGCIGAIATHDLALTTLEAETAGRARNVHFTDRMQAGAMTFDYVLRQGIVKTTNALAVLRMAGIELPEAASARVAESSGSGTAE